MQFSWFFVSYLYRNYHGPENADFFNGNFQVKDEKMTVEPKEEDSDDEIEIVGIKTSDNKNFFVVKDEEEEEKKRRGMWNLKEIIESDA